MLVYYNVNRRDRSDIFDSLIDQEMQLYKMETCWLIRIKHSWLKTLVYK